MDASRSVKLNATFDRLYFEVLSAYIDAAKRGPISGDAWYNEIKGASDQYDIRDVVLSNLDKSPVMQQPADLSHE